jgi:DNA-directed RNA polymerase subunit F
MATKNKNQTMGAYAPQKETLFSINALEKGARVKIVNNAPQQEQEIRRQRAD